VQRDKLSVKLRIHFVAAFGGADYGFRITNCGLQIAALRQAQCKIADYRFTSWLPSAVRITLREKITSGNWIGFL
jgi:GTPase involved in cell partitioning and DNA repair